MNSETMTPDGGSRPPRKGIEHIHRCPVCIRVKDIVLTNTRIARLQLEFIDNNPRRLTDVEFRSFKWNLFHLLFEIEECFVARRIRNFQNMTEEEAQAYLAEECLPENLQFVRPVGPDGEISRPALRIVRDGKEVFPPGYGFDGFDADARTDGGAGL